MLIHRQDFPAAGKERLMKDLQNIPMGNPPTRNIPKEFLPIPTTGMGSLSSQGCGKRGLCIHGHSWAPGGGFLLWIIW